MDIKMDEYTLLQEQFHDLEAEKSVAEELTLDSIEEAYNSRLAAIYRDFDKAIVAIDNRYASQLQATSDEFIQEKRADKERLNNDLTALKERHAAELQLAADRVTDSVEQAQKALDAKRLTIQRQYQARTREIDTLNREMADLSALDFTKRGRLQEQLAVATEARQALSVRLSDLVDESATSSVSSSEAALRSRQTTEINAISEKIEEVSNELEKALGDRKAANEDLNRRIAQEKAPVLRKREVQLTQAEEWREGRLKELENRAMKIQDLNSQISSRAADMTSLRGEINTEERGNQVYRMAAAITIRTTLRAFPGEIAFVATGVVWELSYHRRLCWNRTRIRLLCSQGTPKLKSNFGTLSVICEC